MNIKELYFSNKNITNITNIICKTYNILNTDVRKYTSIKKIILTQMNLIYEKNKAKIMRVTNTQKCIQKLNQVAYLKVNEILKQHKINVQPPVKQKEPDTIMNNLDGEYGCFAPLNGDSMNGFFKADGTIGSKMTLQDETNVPDKTNKLNDIQSAYDMLAVEYDNKHMANTNMHGLRDMTQKRNIPQEINFSLDGGKTSKYEEPSINIQQNMQQMMNYDYNPEYNIENMLSMPNIPNIHNIPNIPNIPNIQHANEMSSPPTNTLQMNNPLNMHNTTKNVYNGNINERFAQLEADKHINKNIYGINRVYSNKNNELLERINDKKRELAQKNNLDPETLMNLTPEQIKQVLQQNEQKDYKLELLKKLAEQKPKKSAINTMLKKKENKVKLTIKSEEWTEPQFYNNYQVKFDIKNVKKIIVVGESEFPLLRPIIDKHHNIFSITYNDDILPIELEPRDDYTLLSIITEMNEALRIEDIPIIIKENKNKTITIENTENKIFSLDLKENSIGIFFGFQNTTYEKLSKYTSENNHMFFEYSYFMFINELSNDAICEITPEGKVIQLVRDIDNKNINTLTIHYRNKNNINSELIEFYETSHEITFDIYN